MSARTGARADASAGRVVPLVAGTELRRRFRNRSAIVTAFIGPLVLATLFGVLLGGTSSFSATIGVTDLDGGDISTAFTSGLVDGDASNDVVTFVRIDGDARQAVADGDVAAAIVVPEGFGDAVVSGQPIPALTALRDPTELIGGEIARAVAERFSSGVNARTLAAATSASLGAPVGPEALADFQESVDTVVRSVAPGGGALDASAYFGASMSILFLFFTVSFAARSMIEERRTSLLPRMMAAGASPGEIAAGKVAAVSLLGLIGFLTVWAVTSLAFGASWGAPLPVVVTMVFTVLAIGGLATFVCGFARTEQQADSYTSAVAFVFALVGGNFVGPGSSPEALRRLAALTPNGQALDAFTRLSVDQAGVADITRNLAVLAVIAVVFGGIGLARIHRTVTA